MTLPYSVWFFAFLAFLTIMCTFVFYESFDCQFCPIRWINSYYNLFIKINNLLFVLWICWIVKLINQTKPHTIKQRAKKVSIFVKTIISFWEQWLHRRKRQRIDRQTQVSTNFLVFPVFSVRTIDLCVLWERERRGDLVARLILNCFLLPSFFTLFSADYFCCLKTSMTRKSVKQLNKHLSF